MSALTEAPTDVIPPIRNVKCPALPRFIRIFAIPIVLAWIALIGILTATPSLIAIKRVGEVFGEYKTSSSVMIVLEGDKPLGPDAHAFYDEIVRDLRADTTHVQHVQDFWGDTLTAAGAQSIDGKASYVQVYISGDQGEALANESVGAAAPVAAAVRHLVASVAAPPGVKAYVADPSATTTDQNAVGDASMETIEALTFGVITLMLLLTIAPWSRR